jgi:hypothetical protein
MWPLLSAILGRSSTTLSDSLSWLALGLHVDSLPRGIHPNVTGDPTYLDLAQQSQSFALNARRDSGKR